MTCVEILTPVPDAVKRTPPVQSEYTRIFLQLFVAFIIPPGKRAHRCRRVHSKHRRTHTHTHQTFTYTHTLHDARRELHAHTRTHMHTRQYTLTHTHTHTHTHAHPCTHSTPTPQGCTLATIESFPCFPGATMATAFDSSLFKYDAEYYEYLPGRWLPGKDVHGGVFKMSPKAIDAAVNVDVDARDVLVATYPKTGTSMSNYQKKVTAVKRSVEDLYLEMTRTAPTGCVIGWEPVRCHGYQRIQARPHSEPVTLHKGTHFTFLRFSVKSGGIAPPPPNSAANANSVSLTGGPCPRPRWGPPAHSGPESSGHEASRGKRSEPAGLGDCSQLNGGNTARRVPFVQTSCRWYIGDFMQGYRDFMHGV